MKTGEAHPVMRLPPELNAPVSPVSTAPPRLFAESDTMPNCSRRNLLRAGALAAGAGILPGTAAASDRAGVRHSFGHTVDFGEQYYTAMMNILECLRRNEMHLIGDLSDRMAETIRKGGTVWMQGNAGHMARFEYAGDLKSNPRILRSTLQWEGSDYDKMKSGDVLLTNYVTENVRAAREKGVYVIGMPVNYIDNEWTPRGFISPNVNNWLLGDVSSVILQSYVPYTQGIVDCPQIPEMKICPSSSNSTHSIYWMFQAEVANKLKAKNPKHVDKSAVFLDTVLSRIREAYDGQKDYMFDHAPTVAKKIGQGAHFHVTSDHPGVQEESNRVAMGPMMTNAFRNDMKKGDVHLLATIDPDTDKILEEAKKAREMGMFVVSIAPANSLKLRQYSDVFIDNLSPEGAGLFDIPGFPEKVATASGIINNTLMWIFTAQFIDEMVRRGWVPYFYLGYFVNGGRKYTEAMKPFFLKQGF